MHFLRLDHESAPYFGGLAFPSYRPLFEDFPLATHVAFGASSADGDPLGLLLAIWSDHPTVPHEILSLYVVETHRQQGIATRLLQLLQEATLQRQHPYLSAEYADNLPAVSALEKVLRNGGFKWAESELITVSGPIASAVQLLPTPPPPDPALELVNWADLTPQDSVEILAFGERRSENSWLNPFANLGLTIHEPTSFVLRYQGRVAGWIQNHELREGVIRYSRLFVDPAQRGRKFSITLFHKSLNTHATLYPQGTSIFAAKSNNTPMLTVINYFKFHPDAQFVSYRTALWAHESVRSAQT